MGRADHAVITAVGQDTLQRTQVVRHEARTVMNVELKDISRRACCKAKEKQPVKGTKKDNVNRVSGKTVSPSEQNDFAVNLRSFQSFLVRCRYDFDDSFLSLFLNVVILL